MNTYTFLVETHEESETDVFASPISSRTSNIEPTEETFSFEL